MDRRFNEIAVDPVNSIFEVMFFPDRIYHDNTSMRPEASATAMSFKRYAEA